MKGVRNNYPAIRAKLDAALTEVMEAEVWSVGQRDSALTMAIRQADTAIALAMEMCSRRQPVKARQSLARQFRGTDLQ
jgi:hypothetical protein